MSGARNSAVGGTSRPCVADLVSGYRQLGALLTVVLRQRAIEDVLDRILETLDALVPADDIVIWESSGADELVPARAHGRDSALMLTLRVRVGEGITGLAAASRKPICSNAAHLDSRARQVPGTPAEAEAILCVPLVVNDLLVGALSLYRAGELTPFGRDERELAQHVADIAAIALTNARTQAELRELAQTDDLTGLANRRRFREELERTLAGAERAGYPVSLLLVDLDGFKLVNDCHGHDEGDEVLRLVATCLRQHTRAGDLVARVGGDEFAVLLPHTGGGDAEALAKRLKRAIGAARTGISACFGVASTERDGAVGLLGEADRLLLDAKRRRGAAAGGQAADDRSSERHVAVDRAEQQARTSGFEPSFSWLGPA